MGDDIKLINGKFSKADEEEPESEKPEVQPIPEPEGTETEAIDVLLLRGLSMGQLVKKGYARSTVRQRIKKLNKLGKLNNEKLPVKSDTYSVSEKARIIPETIEREFEMLFDGNEHDRKIFMAGCSLPLLGMRMFMESQKSVLELMKASNQSVVDMAKAASGGGEQIASETVNQLMPQILASMETQAKIHQKVDVASTANPMRAVMARNMERLMDRMMDGMLTPPGQQLKPSMAPGWKDERTEG